MPLFRRSDAVLITDLPPMRRIMPYIMRRRNDCTVYVEMPADVTSAKKWLWAYNRAVQGEQCTFLHLLLYACRYIIQEFPQIDMFVSGCRFYQRKTSTVSITVKESMEANAPIYTVKLPIADANETLPQYSARIADIFRNASDHQKRVEKETELLLKFPDPIVRMVLAIRTLLDQWNLLPGSLWRDDPLYTSIFLANTGSLGLPESFHHLYEHGNCSTFGLISSLKKQVVADADGNLVVRDILPVRWTVDDRVADGFIYASVMRRFQSHLENPSQYLGLPEDAAQGKLVNRSSLPTSPKPETT